MAPGEVFPTLMATRSNDDPDEELFLELEKDDDHLIDKMREKRMQQLKFE